MHRVTTQHAQPLFTTASLRSIENHAALALAPHALMGRAGLAVARLARALSPHAQTIWIACGPGNNGGDGWEAAARLKAAGLDPVVTALGEPARLPPDAQQARTLALAAGVRVVLQPPAQFDLCIDALLGIGASRAPSNDMAAWIGHMNAGSGRVLSVDLPSGLSSDTGASLAGGLCVRAHDTLSLLALKPGLFTANGRDAAGRVWLDTLGMDAPQNLFAPAAWLLAPPDVPARLHASHKGSYGDVAVIGGAAGMVGAAWLAARAALDEGAGRVLVALLDPTAEAFDASQPELMVRDVNALDLRTLAVVCGCGGGGAVREVLPKVLSAARALVLDADALNAIAVDPQLQALLEERGRRQAPTVLTPHPLEAARLLGRETQAVQADRLAAAAQLAERFGAVVVLKGSGTVIAQAGRPPLINPTGNARLATAGTGDVLAGMVGARLAQGEGAGLAACGAVYRHGLLADNWPIDSALTASALARQRP